MSETLTLPKIPQNKIDRLLGTGDWGLETLRQAQCIAGEDRENNNS
ncbi:MAG: hypothetical protein HEQ35_21720 [Gloeotrichia echinulata IR180]